MPRPTIGQNPWGSTLNSDLDTLDTKIARTYPATVGTDGQLLGKAGGVPAWVAAPSGGTTEAFIVIGNGTNQTTALQTALNNARDSTTIKTVRFHGTVLVDAHASGNAALLIVETGVTLEGVGYSSCIKLRPESFVQNPVGQNIQNWGIVYRSYATLRNFRIDGSRGAIASGTWSEYATNGIGGDWTTPRTGVVFDHLWIHDIGGKNKESFTINCGGGETGQVASYLWTWNNDGSGGVHLTGDPTGVHGNRAEISHVYAWNNGWQGMSTYGFDNARFSDCHAWDNDGNGFNNEWGNDIEYFDCVSHGNGFAGFGTYGDVNNITYHNPISYDNVKDVSNNWRGEFGFLESNIGAVSAGPKTVTINGGRVTPNSGISHVYRSYNATVTTGKKFADVVINHPDAASWIINQPQQTGVQYKGLEYLRPVSTGTQASWANGGVTTAAYALNSPCLLYTSQSPRDS